MTEIGAMFEKEKEEAVTLAKAKALVNSVDRLSKNGNISHEEACRLLDLTEDAYFVAKIYLEEHTKEPVAV